MPVILRTLLLLLMLTPWLQASAEEKPAATDTSTVVLKPFVAYYKGSANGFSIGNLGTRELTPLGDNRYRLEYKASALIYSLEETSVFSVVNGEIRPESYRSVRGTVFNRSKDTLDFDWQHMTVSALHKGERRQYKLIPGTQDPLSASMTLALLLSKSSPTLQYPEAGKRDVETDKLVLVDQPDLKTPMGDISTWHLKRIHDNPKRHTEIWIDKQYPAIPVKVHQTDDGDEFLLNLVKIKFK